MSKENKILDLVVKGEWFDKIKSGEKTHEFRERNRYWDQRLGIDVYCHEVKDSTDEKGTGKIRPLFFAFYNMAVVPASYYKICRFFIIPAIVW